MSFKEKFTVLSNKLLEASLSETWQPNRVWRIIAPLCGYKITPYEPTEDVPQAAMNDISRIKVKGNPLSRSVLAIRRNLILISSAVLVIAFLDLETSKIIESILSIKPDPEKGILPIDGAKVAFVSLLLVLFEWLSFRRAVFGVDDAYAYLETQHAFIRLIDILIRSNPSTNAQDKGFVKFTADTIKAENITEEHAAFRLKKIQDAKHLKHRLTKGQNVPLEQLKSYHIKKYDNSFFDFIMFQVFLPHLVGFLAMVVLIVKYNLFSSFFGWIWDLITAIFWFFANILLWVLINLQSALGYVIDLF